MPGNPHLIHVSWKDIHQSYPKVEHEKKATKSARRYCDSFFKVRCSQQARHPNPTINNQTQYIQPPVYHFGKVYFECWNYTWKPRKTPPFSWQNWTQTKTSLPLEVSCKTLFLEYIRLMPVCTVMPLGRVRMCTSTGFPLLIRKKHKKILSYFANFQLSRQINKWETQNVIFIGIWIILEFEFDLFIWLTDWGWKKSHAHT